MMCYYRSLPRRSVATTTTLLFFDLFLIMLTLTTAVVKDDEISRRAVMIRARRQGCGTSACGYTCCIAIPQQLLQQIQQQQQPQQQQQQQPQQSQQQPQPQQSQPQQSTSTPTQTTISITYTPTPSLATSTLFALNPQQCQCSLYETAASQSSQLQCQCAPTIMPNAVQTQCYCQQSSGSSSNSITQLPQPYQPCQCSSSIQQQSQAQPCQCIPSTNQPANQCICAPPSAGGYTQPYQQQSTPTPQAVYPPQTMMPATLPPPTPPPPSSPSTTIGNSITPAPIGSGAQPSNNVNNCVCGTSQSNLCCTPPSSSNPCLPICQSTCICADQSSTIGGTAIGSGAITTTSATLTTPQPTPPPATAGGISSTPYTFAPYTPTPAPIGSGVITSRPSPATVPCITFTINFPPGTGNSVGSGASTIASTCACQPAYVQCSSKTCCLRYRYRSRDLTGSGVETATTNDAVANALVKVVRPMAVKPMAVYDVIAQPSSIVQQHHPVTQPSPHSLIVKQNDAFARGKQLAKGLLNELLTYLG